MINFESWTFADYAIDHSSEDSSSRSILQRLANLEARLAPLSPHISTHSESSISTRSAAVDGQVAPPQLQHHSGYHETSSNNNAGEKFLQGCSSSSSFTAPIARSLGSGTVNLGPWWTFTLEETLEWSSLREPGFQKPSVFNLTDRPLSEVRLPSRFDSSKNGSLPPSPGRESYVSLDDIDEMSRFVENFLKNIHVRNPLIEPLFLQEQITISAEVGLQWDGAACLLLIVCACGAVASPYNLDTLEDYSAPSISAHDYLSSREYFDAGRKRLGLLGDQPSRLSVECLFFAGVYYLCTLCPVAAWRSFSSASIMCKHYLQLAESEAALEKSDSRQQRRQRSLDSRLFWSCVKSEREVAIELGIHASNIASIENAKSWPSPPTPPVFDDNMMMESLSSEITSPASLMSSDRVTANTHEQSWFYYLTDITIRKFEMQMDEYVLRDGEPPENSTLEERESFYQKIITTLSDADERITAHYSMLPDIIAFDMDEKYHSADDLREYLRYRLLGTRQNLHRPALYIVLHHPDDISNISPSLREQIISMANRALAFDTYFTRHALTTHRHPGTWLLIRHVTRCALELLAALKTQSPWLAMEPQCNETLESCKGALRYWSAESRDAVCYIDWIERIQRG